MNEQNQHSWEVNLEVVSRKGKQAYFCCYINPEGTTAATVTLRNLTQDVFFFTFLLGEFIDFINYQSSLYICKLFFCDFFKIDLVDLQHGCFQSCSRGTKKQSQRDL